MPDNDEMRIDIRLAVDRPVTDRDSNMDSSRIVTVMPGQTLCADSGFMSGHGTYKDNGCLVSSLAGVTRKINKLLTVQPLKSRYNGEVGDVLVGRVVEVQQKQWKVETGGRLLSVLMLSSVNLPAGEQRRKTVQDQLDMRCYLSDGDLISAEVQNIMADGALSLHTRSLKYGKLSQGCLVRVSPSVILRQKNHFHELSCGATLILGNNGYVWICPSSQQTNSAGGYVQNLDRVSVEDREVVSRVRNCVLLLSHHYIMLYDSSVIYAYEESHNFENRDLLRPEVMLEVANLTRQRLAREMSD